MGIGGDIRCLSCLGKNRKSLPWFVLELSLRRRAFLLSHESSHSSERVSPKRDLVGNLCVFLFSSNPGEGPHFWAKSSLAQARRSRPNENSWNLQCSFLAVSPKRELIAWAKDPFRLSEGPWLERGWCRNLLYGYSLPCFQLLIVWLIGLPYLKHEICGYACIIWLFGIGIDELGVNKCMNHDWLIGWILAWDCYAW